MIAVITERSIVFANSIAPGYGGRIRQNVKLDLLPEDYDASPDGAEIPQQVLAESETEPGRYRLFKYQREIRGSGFRATGRNFGGTFDVYPG